MAQPASEVIMDDNGIIIYRWSREKGVEFAVRRYGKYTHCKKAYDRLWYSGEDFHPSGRLKRLALPAPPQDQDTPEAKALTADLWKNGVGALRQFVRSIRKASVPSADADSVESGSKSDPASFNPKTN